MHRLLVETGLLNEDSPVLPAEAARHLRVLRPRDGECVELFDGKGGWRTYSFCGTRDVAAPLLASSQVFQASRTTRALTLFACVTKGSRWDWTIEKATELGVTRIVPVISDRTIVRIPKADRAAKRERWQRVAEDATRQSDAKWVPEICEVVDFRDVVALVRETTCFIGALTNPPSPPLAKAIAEARPLSTSTSGLGFSVFIGPEGDFTPNELDALMKVAIPTSFGPTILRAETAAIYAVSVLAAALTE